MSETKERHYVIHVSDGNRYEVAGSDLEGFLWKVKNHKKTIHDMYETDEFYGRRPDDCVLYSYLVYNSGTKQYLQVSGHQQNWTDSIKSAKKYTKRGAAKNGARCAIMHARNASQSNPRLYQIIEYKLTRTGKVEGLSCK